MLLGFYFESNSAQSVSAEPRKSDFYFLSRIGSKPASDLVGPVSNDRIAHGVRAAETCNHAESP